MRRVMLALLTLALVGCGGSYDDETLPDFDPSAPPGCDIDASWPLTLLLMQSVPSAEWVPCVREVPSGWSYVGTDVTDRGALMSFQALATTYRLEVVFEPSCSTEGAGPGTLVPPESDVAGPITVLERRPSLDGGFPYERLAVFEGGCIRERFSEEPTGIGITGDAGRIVSAFDRVSAAGSVEERYGVVVCGAGAPPCAG